MLKTIQLGDSVITFDMRFRTIVTDRVQARLQKAIADSPSGKAESPAVIELAAHIIAATKSIDITPGSNEMVLDFAEFWQWLSDHVLIWQQSRGGRVAVSINDAAAAGLWDKWALLVANAIQEVWYEAFSAAQVLHPADDVYLPDSALPKEKLGDADFLESGRRP